MITDVTFGECLKYMLTSLDISINRLSKAINVDSSLVNRWIHGTRIPAYHTPYIESITEYLSKNIRNSFQIQQLNELYLNICKDHELKDCNKEKIRNILSEAQGYSIECKKGELKRDKSSLKNKELIASDFIDSIALSSNEKIIFGTKNIISSCIFLLEAALKKERNDNKLIYITVINEMDIDLNSCDEAVRWQDLLIKALNSEWHVLMLLRLNNNIDRTLRFIKFVFPLLKTGRLDIHYLKKYDTTIVERELCVISEIGALSCFSTLQHPKINCAFYFENKVAIDIFKDYIHVLLTNSSQPLIKYFSQENNFDYKQYIMKNKESAGDQALFEYCLNMTIFPENLYEKLLKRKNLSNDEMQKELNLYKKQWDAFLFNIQNYACRDICLSDSIMALVEHRQYCYCSDTGMEIMALEVGDIVEYLQNIIRLLETYDKYIIAFIPRNFVSTMKIDNYCFLVKERQAVLLRICEPLKSMQEVRLLIDEPMFVQAFNEYFNGIWESIAPIYKDKKETIKWLQRQVGIVKSG